MMKKLIYIILFINILLAESNVLIVQAKKDIRISFANNINIDNIKIEMKETDMIIKEKNEILKIVKSNFKNIKIIKKSKEFNYIDAKIE